MATAEQWLDTIANNLANASTNGFKRDGLTFDDGLLRQMATNEGTGRPLGSIGSGAVVKGQYTDFSPGALNPTGNVLDLALKSPNGAFAVQTPQGYRYTRDGSFQLNADRLLVDRQGNAVLNRQHQPITVPKGTLGVAPDGSVTVDGKAFDQIGVFAGAFAKDGNNLLRSADAQPLDTAQVVSGSLESSNVNAVEEMIAMIRLNRAFELAQRSVQSQDESTQRLVSSLQGR